MVYLKVLPYGPYYHIAPVVWRNTNINTHNSLRVGQFSEWPVNTSSGTSVSVVSSG